MKVLPCGDDDGSKSQAMVVVERSQVEESPCAPPGFLACPQGGFKNHQANLSVRVAAAASSGHSKPMKPLKGPPTGKPARPLQAWRGRALKEPINHPLHSLHILQEPKPRFLAHPLEINSLVDLANLPRPCIYRPKANWSQSCSTTLISCSRPVTGRLFRASRVTYISEHDKASQSYSSYEYRAPSFEDKVRKKKDQIPRAPRAAAVKGARQRNERPSGKSPADQSPWSLH